MEQMANTKAALFDYEDLVFSTIWESTVPVHHPDRLRACVEWVDTSIKSKRLTLTDANLKEVRTVLEKVITAFQYKSRVRQEAEAELLLARAIHVNARCDASY